MKWERWVRELEGHGLATRRDSRNAAQGTWTRFIGRGFVVLQRGHWKAKNSGKECLYTGHDGDWLSLAAQQPQKYGGWVS